MAKIAAADPEVQNNALTITNDAGDKILALIADDGTAVFYGDVIIAGKIITPEKGELQ
jgi:hypothetical protein